MPALRHAASFAESAETHATTAGAMLGAAALMPTLGAPARSERASGVRRLLLRTTRYHVYYRGNALLGFGHLAQRFRAIPSTALVAAAINAGLADTDAFVRGQADAAADDYEQFIGPLPRNP